MNNNNHLIQFFTITFLWSWLLWLPQVLDYFGANVPEVLQFFGNFAIFGPLVSSFTLTLKAYGKEGLKKLLKKGVDIDFQKKWLIPTLFLSPLLAFLSLIVVVQFEGDSVLAYGISWQMFFPVMALIFLTGGPLAEEYGWRGFALGRLQNKWDALTSALIVGLIWSIWHIPLHFISGTTQEQIPLYQSFIIIPLSSIFYTWLYNNTGGSVLIAMLFHLSGNMGGALFPYWLSDLGRWIFFILNVIVLIPLIYYYGIERLSKDEKETFRNY